MVSRVWVGLGVVLLAVVGLSAGWRIDESGGDAGVVAALSLLALAAGCLLVASTGGEVAVRATGGALSRADDDIVYTWGRNDSGQLGDGSTVRRAVPVTIQTSLDAVSAVAAGDGFALAAG